MTEKNLKRVNTFLFMLASFGFLLLFLPVLGVAFFILLAMAGSSDAKEEYFIGGWFNTAKDLGLYIFVFTSIGGYILSRRSIHRMGGEQIKRWELVRDMGKRRYINLHIKRGLRLFLHTCPFMIIGTLALYYLSDKSYDLGLLASLIIAVLLFAILILTGISIIYGTRQWALNENRYNSSLMPQSNISFDRMPRS